MNRIDRTFSELKSQGRKALVCFVTAGDPNLDATKSLVPAIAEAGADIIELGVPFSDPMAEGPTIQASSLRAISAGTTIDRLFECIKEIRIECDTPLVLMTYSNPVISYGFDRFAQNAAVSGADGVIMTDMPPEEAGEWKEAADNAGLATIFLVAPTSTKDRIKRAANMASGFIYCVSRTGVTGARSDIPIELGDLVGRIKDVSDLPVVVGFGISKPEHVAGIFTFADGAVVGSALVDVIAKSSGSREMVSEFVRSLR